MKKTILYTLLLVFYCLTLFGCNPKADTIVLPSSKAVSSIMVTDQQMITVHMQEDWISQCLAAVSAAKPTAKQSVQDVPDVDGYVKIDFVQDGGASTVYLYQERGNYYIEQPYQGIYLIDSDTVDWIRA